MGARISSGVRKTVHSRGLPHALKEIHTKWLQSQATKSNNITGKNDECKICGFNGGDYEECRLL
jgi:hypothetical protein